MASEQSVTRWFRELESGDDQAASQLWQRYFDKLNDLDGIIDDNPTPEFLAILAEEHLRLINVLDDEALRRIANWKMEGYTNDEIAQRLGLACRSVERKVQRIRQAWRAEIEK